MLSGASTADVSSFAAFRVVLWQWFDAARHSAMSELSAWTQESEWPLLCAAKWLMASFVVHALGYAMAKVGGRFGFCAPPIWEGRTGWRKPMLFGVSNAMVFSALREGLRSQTMLPRAAAAHTACMKTR